MFHGSCRQHEKSIRQLSKSAQEKSEQKRNLIAKYQINPKQSLIIEGRQIKVQY